jgi:hypothetical protein
MYKVVTCHSCMGRFAINLTKGEPYAPICKKCAKTMNRNIDMQQERKNVFRKYK